VPSRFAAGADSREQQSQHNAYRLLARSSRVASDAWGRSAASSPRVSIAAVCGTPFCAHPLTALAATGTVAAYRSAQVAVEATLHEHACARRGG
jgi:hypothetical protein